jgi:hypothetical protein
MGGSSAARLNLLSSTTLGAAGGAQTPPGPNATLAVDTSAPTQNAADFGHTHVGGSIQPTLILNYIVRV